MVSRETLLACAESLILKVYSQYLKPMKECDVMSLKRLVLCSLSVDTKVYLSYFQRLDSEAEECVNKLVKEVELAKAVEIKPMSFDSANLFIWLSSREYQEAFESKKKDDARSEFITTNCSKLLNVSQFSFSLLFDALFLISSSRKQLLDAPTERYWKDSNRKLYGKVERVRSVARKEVAYYGGWGLFIGIKSIQEHMGAISKFANKENMASLKKVLYQLKVIDISNISLGDSPFVPADRLYSRKEIKNLKRLDAAIDELFVHIYRRRFEVQYKCEQTEKTTDDSFVCVRQFHTANHSLLHSGRGVDDRKGSTSFYSLFTLSGYRDLISQLDGWFANLSPQ